MPNEEQVMKIYGVPLSVHTRKVILAARIKAIAHEVVVVIPVIPDSPPANWREISPTGLVPAIEDGALKLADSTAILHYLERKHPTPALLPADDRAFARALFLDAWAGSALFRDVVHPIFHNQVVKPNIRKIAGDPSAIDTAMTRAAPAAFGYLEGQEPKDFLVGDGLSIADLAVVSNLVMFHYLGGRIEARFPKLDAYFRRRLDAPEWRAALAGERPYVDQMGLDRSFVH